MANDTMNIEAIGSEVEPVRRGDRRIIPRFRCGRLRSLDLKPGGSVVFVEYRAEDPRVPIKRLHKMTEAQIKRETAAYPQRVWERTVRRLPWQHLVEFRKRA